MAMTEEQRQYARQQLEIAREAKFSWPVFMFEYMLERDLGPQDFDDLQMGRMSVAFYRENYDPEGNSDVRVPADFGGGCVHLCGSSDRQQWLIVVATNCNDGDFFFTIGKGDRYEGGYLVIPERRRAPHPLTHAELRALAMWMAIALRHVAPESWKTHLVTLTQAWNEVAAQIDHLMGKPVRLDS